MVQPLLSNKWKLPRMIANIPSSWDVYKLNIETGAAKWVREFGILTEKEIKEKVAAFNRVLSKAADRQGATPDNSDCIYIYAPKSRKS